MNFRLVALLVVLVAVCGIVYAQDAPKVEIGAGYMYARQGLEEFSPINIHDVNLNGWNVSLAGNLNRWFGIEGDFSGAYGGPKIDLGLLGAPGSVKINERIYTYMFGPKFAYRKSEKVVPFAHVLFGGVHATVGADVNDSGFPGKIPDASDNSFAWAIGGGADFPLTKRFALRSQFDYVRTSFVEVNKDHQDNIRVVGGVVFRF